MVAHAARRRCHNNIDNLPMLGGGTKCSPEQATEWWRPMGMAMLEASRSESYVAVQNVSGQSQTTGVSCWHAALAHLLG